MRCPFCFFSGKLGVSGRKPYINLDAGKYEIVAASVQVASQPDGERLLRYFNHESQKARWSRRLAFLAFMIYLVTFTVHRLGELQTPFAMNISGIAIAVSLFALVLGIAAMINIWNEGYTGTGKALSGALLSALVLAGPVWLMPNILTLPRIYEVTTDPNNPPRFSKIASLRRGEGVNPPAFQRSAVELQNVAYPDLQPLPIDRPVDAAFSAVRDAVKNMSWRIVSEVPPSGSQAGLIEATHQSLIFGFRDDVAIRVRPMSAGGTRVDVRASARYGNHDMGRNAMRVRTLFSEVKTRLAEIDQKEALAELIALRELRAQKARAEKERKRLIAERKESQQRRRQAAVRRESLISQSGNEYRSESEQQPVRSRSERANGRRLSRRRRQAVRTRAHRKFWEELNR